MSIYEGDPVQRSYAQGRDKGYAWGEQDVNAGLGTTSAWLHDAQDNAETASTRTGRAYALGYLRGYREAVRTYAHGRWGL